MNIMKLQKAIQAAGFDSRRTIRQAIHDGEFKVNGQTATDPNQLVDMEKDVIRYNDRRLKLKIERKAYYLFHKPDGVISTLSDPEGRPTIAEYISRIRERVYPVGRLDYHSEGLMLLTNDGELANFIISPRNRIPKVYTLKIKGVLTKEERERYITEGVIVDGQRVKPMNVEYLKRTAQDNSWIRVTIIEGKKHIVRKMFLYSGHPVEKLKRVSIGTFQLKSLPRGEWREATDEELEQFRRKFHERPTHGENFHEHPHPEPGARLNKTPRPRAPLSAKRRPQGSGRPLRRDRRS